jgi:hypothetical protein
LSDDVRSFVRRRTRDWTDLPEETHITQEVLLVEQLKKTDDIAELETFAETRRWHIDAIVGRVSPEFVKVKGDVGQVTTIELHDVLVEGVVEDTLLVRLVDEADQEQLVAFDSSEFVVDVFDEGPMRLVETWGKHRATVRLAGRTGRRTRRFVSCSVTSVDLRRWSIANARLRPENGYRTSNHDERQEMTAGKNDLGDTRRVTGRCSCPCSCSCLYLFGLDVVGDMSVIVDAAAVHAHAGSMSVTSRYDDELYVGVLLVDVEVTLIDVAHHHWTQPTFVELLFLCTRATTTDASSARVDIGHSPRRARAMD